MNNKVLCSISLILTLVLTILLVGCGDENVLFKDNTYVITKGEKGVDVQVVSSYVPEVHDAVKSSLDTTNLPCLTVLKYDNNKLTVSSYNYDGDAKKNFKLWELAAAKDITFNSVTVVDSNGNVEIESIEIPQEEYQHIGEYYTYGYFEFNEKAEVTHITFYGETIIQG